MKQDDEDADYEVIHLLDKFPSETNISDIDYINQLKQEGDWIIITGDERILSNRRERRTLIESELRYFVFVSKYPNKLIYEQARRFITAWPEILRISQDQSTDRRWRINKNCKFLSA